MSSQTPDQWAENILSKPVGLGDDYGNLLISLGATKLDIEPSRSPEQQDPPLEASNHATPTTVSAGPTRKPPSSTSTTIPFPFPSPVPRKIPPHFTQPAVGSRSPTRLHTLPRAQNPLRPLRHRNDRRVSSLHQLPQSPPRERVSTASPQTSRLLLSLFIRSSAGSRICERRARCVGLACREPGVQGGGRRRRRKAAASRRGVAGAGREFVDEGGQGTWRKARCVGIGGC